MCEHLKKLGASRGYRAESGEFLCDGIKLLEEAVNNDAEITNVLTASCVPFPLPLDTRIAYADRRIIDSISPLQNAQDTVFSCKIPLKSALADISGTHILLDGVQDPGNVGTIIRTANAFGVGSVILTNGCADPYNPKTVRATMGALFRQKIFQATLEELRALCDNGARIIGAIPGGAALIPEVAVSGAIIAVGSEGRGLSDEILSMCNEKVTIPISPDCESLNAAVAASIFMWEARCR